MHTLKSIIVRKYLIVISHAVLSIPDRVTGIIAAEHSEALSRPCR
jgi:hypothetical protein